MMTTVELWLLVGALVLVAYGMYAGVVWLRANDQIRKMEGILDSLSYQDWTFNSPEERSVVVSMIQQRDWDGALTILMRKHRSLRQEPPRANPVPEPLPRDLRRGSPTRPPPPPPTPPGPRHG